MKKLPTPLSGSGRVEGCAASAWEPVQVTTALAWSLTLEAKGNPPAPLSGNMEGSATGAWDLVQLVFRHVSYTENRAK